MSEIEAGLLGPTSRPAARVRDGVAANARLTGALAAALLVLLAAEGATIPFIGRLLGPHIFTGVLRAPPVALKMASTGYRFARYYTHDGPYVAKGPPPVVLRVLAPGVVLTTGAVRHRDRAADRRAAERDPDLRPQAELHRLGRADDAARPRAPARGAEAGDGRLAARGRARGAAVRSRGPGAAPGRGDSRRPCPGPPHLLDGGAVDLRELSASA